MPGFLHIMRCVGRAVVKNGAGALVNLIPFGNSLFEIARDALEEYRKGTSNSEAALRTELEAVAQAPPAEVRKVAEEVAATEAKNLPEQIRLTLVSTLSRMQDSTRHSLRRPADPSGKTVPASLSLKTPTDLLQFLPTRPPRFKPGDRPLPGVGWELEKLLGVGGFGEVWKARNARLTNITAALKFCLDPEAGAALVNEGANLNHLLKAGYQAGIVQLKNAYLDAEPYCLEYEFIEGDDLAGAIHKTQAARGPLTPDTATRIILRLARTVGRVHRLSPPLVHRDLKPANVLVQSKEGKSEFLITDFGIGGVAASQALEQTRQGVSGTPMLTSLQGAHTPLYASPEQKRGEPPDPRDDVHALGVIWYQLLVSDMSQAPPFDWIAELQSRKVDGGIIDVLGRCIAGKAERRPTNAAALAEQIEKLLGRPKPASIPAITLASSRNPAVYGEAVTFTATVKAPPDAAGTPTGKLSFADGATVLGEAPLSEGSATLTRSLSASSYAITVSYSGDAVFSACKSPSLSQTVTQAPLQVKAADASKVCGQANPSFAATYSGFVHGDSETALDGKLSFSTSATADSPAGSYAVTPSGLTSRNYSITFLLGTLTVAPNVHTEQDMKNALEEWRTRGSLGKRKYFEREGPSRIGGWQAVAQRGDAAAQWLLACCLRDGIATQKDTQTCVTWLRRAAERGLAVAQNDLGDCYDSGEGAKADSAEAFRWYSKAAKQGFAEAQKNVGVCYYQGDGVAEDRVEAVRWFRKAADQGWGEAQYALGDCYATGAGVSQDAAESARWYRQAAETGYPLGQTLLGNCYFDGCGVEQDYPQAIGWYRKAAEQGEPGAQSNLGHCYETGQGVKKDWAEAAKWYRKAAEQGNDEAQFALGHCYQQGRGVEEDLAQAEQWYRKAADQGHRKAKNALKKLAPEEQKGKQQKETSEGEKEIGERDTRSRRVEPPRRSQGSATVPAGFTSVNPLVAGPQGQGQLSAYEQDLKDALEEWRRKGSPQAYFEREAPTRIGSWRPAAQKGDAAAQWLLARCLLGGIGTEQDIQAAVAWLRRAAESGLAVAQNDLGDCCYEGEGVGEDESQAFHWFTKAAEQGVGEAQRNVGFCYAHGAGVAENDVEAVRWYRKAAEQGWAEAQNDLGDCYSVGAGVPEDLAEAVRWYRKAAESGYPQAQVNLGWSYELGEGVEEDPVEAAGWFRKAAELDHPEGQYCIGECYLQGLGVEQDCSQAITWVRKAAEAEHPKAQVTLGWWYELGQGVEKDPVEAARWYRKAAEEGHPDGQNLLGNCYFSGNGVEQDYPQAIGWFRKAADQGQAVAQNNLGYCYDRGKGVKKDRVEAVKWYRKAAEQDYDVAQFNLGYAYHLGHGVEKDLAQAEHWYRKAADQGYRRAKNFLKKLAREEQKGRQEQVAPDDEKETNEDDAPSEERGGAGSPDRTRRPRGRGRDRGQP
jgi:TPR repeat protein